MLRDILCVCFFSYLSYSYKHSVHTQTKQTILMSSFTNSLMQNTDRYLTLVERVCVFSTLSVNDL